MIGFFEMNKIYLSLKFISLAVLFSVVVLLFKYYIRYGKYYTILPSRPRFISDMLITISCYYYWNKNKFNGYSIQTMILQYLASIFHLYRNEHIMCTWFTLFPFIGVVSPEAVKEALSGMNFHEKAWIYRWMHCIFGTGLLTSHGKKWKYRRQLLTSAFHFDILKEFLPIINKKSKILIEKWKNETLKEYTNVLPYITFCSLDIICETTLGIEIKAQENNESEYVKAVGKVSNELTMRFLNPISWFDFTFFLTFGRSLKKDIKIFKDFTLSVIQTKKKEFRSSKNPGKITNSKRKSLMEKLLHHHFDKRELTDEDIREEVDTFTAEGHDTVSIVLTWTLYLIGLYKDVQFKIHEELDQIFGNETEKPITIADLSNMKYLECVIKETLRLYPPAPLLARKSGENMTICGYPIPKGTILAIFPYQLHRNEKLYPNPEMFDPNRFTPENSIGRHPFAYIPFSAGPRNCIGQKFAIMELKTVLSDILRNFTLHSLDPRDKVLPSFQITLHFSMPVRIKISQRKKFHNSN